MLNPFPTLLTLSLLAPFLLRIVLGITFIYFGKERLKGRNFVQVRPYVEIIGGLMLIFGIYTQIAALAFAIILGYELIEKIGAKAFLTNGVNYYLILFVMSICLLLTGAGALAFDLPL